MAYFMRMSVVTERTPATLCVTLTRLGIAWIDDPSNTNAAFERVRVRRALGVLDDLGVGAAAIATSSRRLARA